MKTCDGPTCAPGGCGAHGCADAGVCDGDGGRCIGCLKDGDCKDPSRPRCDPASRQCARCLGDGDCASGQICAGGQCLPGCSNVHACNGNLSCCGSACADLTADAKNCGLCGHACAGGGLCCASTCVDTATDPQNCGACGNACAFANAAAACSGKLCLLGLCNAGFANCDHMDGNGCETMLSAPGNCGACGRACAGTNVVMPGCAAGACTGACAMGYADCDADLQTNGCEVHTDTDAMNCGACGTVCSGANVVNSACAAGACSGACAMGYADCDANLQSNGCETRILDDPMNCGGCHVRCKMAESCIAGVCVCPPPVDGGPACGPLDAGVDAAVPDSGADLAVPDAGATDLAVPDAAGDGSVVPPGCATNGIVCSGNWAGQCMPACKATECCSPQSGTFVCVAKTNGVCPLPDIYPDRARIAGKYYFEWRYFNAGDCALVEQCIGGAGWRRLLRFDTWTPNIGGADLFLGPPDGQFKSYFQYSPCHNHYHFSTYADYILNDLRGNVAALGHKQAFCLEDFFRYPVPDPVNDPNMRYYGCMNQGIEVNWQDVYHSDLDCQWIDVTGIALGNYSMHVAINTAHILAESNYANNDLDVPITVPTDIVDATQPCQLGEKDFFRDCGWTVEAMKTCTPGVMVTAACSAKCGLGSCTGDTVMRACDGAGACDSKLSLAWNDDSGCDLANPGSCSSGGDCCSKVQFTCPADGKYTIMAAPFDSAKTMTCTVRTMP